MKCVLLYSLDSPLCEYLLIRSRFIVALVESLLEELPRFVRVESVLPCNNG